MHITCDFEGGNIVVEEIRPGLVRLHQNLRDTDGPWFYWLFEARDAGGQTVRFEFTKSVAIGARGPAVSRDGGKTWKWLGIESADENSFTYTFGPGENAVRFGVTIPHTERDWKSFLTRCNWSEYFEEQVLCQSRKGRPVPLLRSKKAAQFTAFVSARHHCCETLGSYTLEGILEFVLGNTEDAAWLRENVEFVFVPFVDPDGTEEGDQGKNRAPRDHNRDYDGENIYPETVAIQKLIADWAQKRPGIGLDIHCPWLKTGIHEVVHFVGSKFDRIWQEQERFSRMLESVRKGPLPYLASDNLPYGKDWNVDSSFTKGASFCKWAAENTEWGLVTALEVPYASAHGVEVNAESARQLGGDLGMAIAGYLRG